MKKILLITSTVGIVLLSSCKPTKQTVDSPTEELLSTVQTQEVFLKVFGTEPFWNVELASDKVVFKDVEGRQVVFKYNPPQENEETRTKKYHLISAGYDLTIDIAEDYCSDGMSDNEYNYKASVALKEKGAPILNQSGCARYLLHPQLEGKWYLKQLDLKKISDQEEYATPYLQFDATENRMYGNTSCNGINGAVYTEGALLKFSHLVTTMMICSNENIEEAFLKALRQVTRFEVEDTTLKLFADEELKMILKK